MNRKIAKNRKLLREADILSLLEQGQIECPPLRVQSITLLPQLGAEQERKSGSGMDAIARVSWGEKEYAFGVKCRSLSTPKTVDRAAETIQNMTRSTSLFPLVLVPYLSEERLAQLWEKGVSGVDLCGNGIVQVPGELFVYRTGAPNRFPQGTGIKNVYRKNSSIVARTFLLRPVYTSLGEIRREVEARGGQITLATVSKVCRALEEDLVIGREREAGRQIQKFRLLQPEPLLGLLAEHYSPPEITRRFRGKTSLPWEELEAALAAWESQGGGRIVRTGAGSTGAYAVMAREPVESFYCTDLDGLLRHLGGAVRETERFADLELLETTDRLVYFDRRPGLVASPIQTYLELAAGDKRDRETAEQARQVILRPLRE